MKYYRVVFAVDDGDEKAFEEALDGFMESDNFGGEKTYVQGGYAAQPTEDRVEATLGTVRWSKE